MIKFWLQDHILDESSEAGGGGSSETTETEESSEESSENEDEETTEDETEEDEELNEEELKNAKGLFKLLKDPNTRDVVLRTMAEKAGVLKDPPTTKVEEKKAVRDVRAVIKDALGPEYDVLLGDRLTKGLEELFAQQREENQQSAQSLRLSQIETETDRAFERLDRDTKGDSRKYRQSMTALADRILPAEGVSTFEYLKILYSVASGEKKTSAANKQIADKINRNRSDVADRTHQLTTSGGKKTEGGQMQTKGLKNIVEEAIAGLQGKK